MREIIIVLLVLFGLVYLGIAWFARALMGGS